MVSSLAALAGELFPVLQEDCWLSLLLKYDPVQLRSISDAIDMLGDLGQLSCSP